MTRLNSPPKLTNSGLYVLLAGQLLPMIDFSIVNVALDAISRSFQVSASALALMVAAYGIAFAVCLAMGGRLGDNFGRRRVFRCGVLFFGIASLLCGLADTIWLLLAARALQGVGAALIVPQVMATIHVALSGHAHSRALGLYGAIGGLAFIFGQVLGGYLVSADVAGMGWRIVFLINLPVCLAVLVSSYRWLPESRQEHAAMIDLPGTLLLTGVILSLLLPLALGPSLQWSWPCLAPLVAVFPLLAALWRFELRQERQGAAPLLPPSLLRLPSVRFGLFLGVLFFACWSGFMFVLALTLQGGAGRTPSQSGDAFVALGVAFFVASLQSSRLVARLGKVGALVLGCAIQMTGLVGLMLTLEWIWPHPGVLSLLPATVLIGVGQAFIVSCFFRIGLCDVPAEQAGAASSMLSTIQQAAVGLGSALLGTVFAQSLRHFGDYLDGALAALIVEFFLMLVLTLCAVAYRQRQQRLVLTARFCPG